MAGSDLDRGRPRVTIVTPSFNQGSFLGETIRSVLEQDYPDIEYIVVDGGSTDGSVEQIHAVEDRLAWWVSEADRGQVEALTKGFTRATGEILGWLNADDTLLPGAVATAVSALEARPDVDLVYGSNVCIDEGSNVLAPLAAQEFDAVEMVRTCHNRVVQPGSLFRRRALTLAGPLDESIYYYFDFDFVLRLALAGGRAVRIPHTLATYRLHPASKTGGDPVRKAHDHIRFYERLFSRPDLPPEWRGVEREARARASMIIGEYFYLGGDHRSARRHYLHGLRLHPRLLSLRATRLLGRALLPSGLVARLRATRAAA